MDNVRIGLCPQKVSSRLLFILWYVFHASLTRADKGSHADEQQDLGSELTILCKTVSKGTSVHGAERLAYEFTIDTNGSFYGARGLSISPRRLRRRRQG